MASCKECGGSVSPRARACPHCGEPSPARVSFNLGTILFLLILFLALFGVGQDALLNPPAGWGAFRSVAVILMVAGGFGIAIGGFAIMLQARATARKFMVGGVIAVGLGAYLAFSGI